MKTFSATPEDIDKKWIIVDAEDVIVGRLAAFIATRLRGKHLPSFTPNMDCGDNVIVINAEKVAFTGKKVTDKKYYWHTGYPGGIKERTAGKMLESKRPEYVVTKAVQRMLPKGALGKQQLSNLKVYAGSEHPHEAQQPEAIDVKALNPKNVRRA
ncbi:MAG: 50S ribosomal protein L13 [Alphaproteobacteria bacterium]